MISNTNKIYKFAEFCETKVSAEAIIIICADYLATAPHVLQPQQEAVWLLQHLLGRDFSYSELVLLTNNQCQKLLNMLFERVNLAKPLAYILGNIYFVNLEILCEPPILIPRVETESWVLRLINELEAFRELPLQIIDLCTGSGCIALAIAKYFPKFSVLGVDIDSCAIALAERNKVYNNITNAEFVQSDIFASDLFASDLFYNHKKFNITKINKLNNFNKINIFISNPPYVTTSEYEELGLEVKNWEAKHALVAGVDGLWFYEKIITQVAKALELCADTDADADADFNSNVESDTNAYAGTTSGADAYAGSASAIAYAAASETGLAIPSLVLEMSPPQIHAVQKILTNNGFTSKIILDNFEQQRALFSWLIKSKSLSPKLLNS